jgi:hypothetical protein
MYEHMYVHTVSGLPVLPCPQHPNDEELKWKLLDVFVAIKQRMHRRCDASEAYNLALLSQFYEEVKKYYGLQTSQRLHHQLFLMNRKLNSYKEK